ncbi:hypothetical protein, partial [Solemya velum gill symbiont]|uniref:hypothetical protein n=1 Tax=Solemya velum gill symbiont TaxID=2340 RepID=UPI0015C3FCA2
ELLHNQNIIIRPADKGSGIVIVDRDEYVSSLRKEMEESESYGPTKGDMTRECHKQVKRLVNKMHRDGAISDDLKTYLVPKYVQSGKLKGNPKLHKPTATYRAIVSGIGTPTEKMAEVAEHELKKFVESSPSYIRDTVDFINKLKEINEPLPADSILFCFDVCKLYPSIPKKEGLEACEEALLARPTPLIDTQHTLKMIETVLENNCFGFGSNYYIQKEGVAIGSRLGKNYVCTYMRKWDEELLNTDKTPLFYKRFIDDGFGIWVGNERDLKTFAHHANSIHTDIRVELRYDRKQIEFLDTLVKLENGHVYTDLYVKPSDKQLYLKSSSCHPPSTKRGLVYGLGLRLRRICEKQTDYEKHRHALKHQLRIRGYSGRMIEDQLKKVDKMERSALLQPGKKHSLNSKDTDRVPLILTYSHLLPNIPNIVNKHTRVLHQSERMKTIFDQPPIVAYRRDNNLCDVLVHGKTNRVLRCDWEECREGCECCNILSGADIKDTAEYQSYKPVKNVNCRRPKY